MATMEAKETKILEQTHFIGGISPLQRAIKRTIDFFFSLILLILLSPLMLALAVLVKLDSPGAALFQQARVGEGGRFFIMYKFRSMVADAEIVQKQLRERDKSRRILHKRADDPRVTHIGRFLRRTSLDELPQLWNVLKGDMSLVGPRPELPWLVEQYEPWQRERLDVPQGLTGWWQINGRSDKPMHLHTEDDLYYIHHYSLWLDFYILIQTAKVVLCGKGAF